MCVKWLDGTRSKVYSLCMELSLLTHQGFTHSSKLDLVCRCGILSQEQGGKSEKDQEMALTIRAAITYFYMLRYALVFAVATCIFLDLCELRNHLELYFLAQKSQSNRN